MASPHPPHLSDMSSPSSSRYSLIGGARIGFVNYTWPLARLTATAETLTLSTTLFGLYTVDSFTFRRDQVVSIQEGGSIPILTEGITIQHTIAEYPRNLIFWCSPKSTLQGIARTGFRASATMPSVETGSPLETGVPFRWWPVVLLVLVWNGLFTYGIYGASGGPEPYIFTAICLMAAISLSLLLSPTLQRLVVKKGRHFGEIRSVVVLILAITGLMTVIFGATLIGKKDKSTTNTIPHPTSSSQSAQ